MMKKIDKNQKDLFGKRDNDLPEDIIDLMRSKTVVDRHNKKKFREKRRLNKD